jgi:hypothetical protein
MPTLTFDAGMVTRSRRMALALRMRVSMSAMGSVIMIWSLSSFAFGTLFEGGACSSVRRAV